MSFKINIDGLNAQQRALADILWQCETLNEVDTFINGLPTTQLKTEAKNIVELMILATIEQYLSLIHI